MNSGPVRMANHLLELETPSILLTVPVGPKEIDSRMNKRSYELTSQVKINKE